MQAPVEEIIKEIERKYNVSITYDADITHLNVTDTDLLFQNTKVEDVLDILIKDTEITYKKLRADFYVLLKKDKKNPSQNNEKTKQQFIIEGKVLDENNLILPGVNVNIKGTAIGAITDMEGKFQLYSLTETGVLTISFIGYKTQEVNYKANENLTVQMELDVFKLDEIIVSGVADNTPTKKLTVTVAKVNSEDINQAPSSSAAGSLQGKIPGVMVKSANGTPGSGSTIRLRGSTSLVGNQAPLIIVDGNMINTSLADINVDDIENIEVVKGAAAASLYGSKAGNGVVVITTKRGNHLRNSATEIILRNEIGISSLVNKIELASHHPYKLAVDDDQFSFTKYEGVTYDENGNVLSGNRILTDNQFADQPYSILKDHQDDFYNNGTYYTNYISVGSKQEKLNLFLSFENNRQTGIVFNTEGYKRQNFRFNADLKINSKITLSTSNLIIKSKSDEPGSDNSFFDLLFINPDIDLEALNNDGTKYKILPDHWSIEENPLYPLYYRSRETKRNTVMSNIMLKYQIVRNLYIDAKYTFEKQDRYWNTLTPRGYLANNGATYNGSLYKEVYNSAFQTFQATANFNKTFNKFTIKAKASYLFEDQNYTDMAVTGNEFIAKDIPQLNNTNNEKATLNSYQGIIRAENIFGIMDVDYSEKYLISALYRYDGSSLFGEDARWNPYYRVAAAYRITEDLTIKGIDELKIRVAYGTAGQRPGFSNQYETWNISNGNLSKSTLGNKNLKPSESKELEIACDIMFLNKFDFTASYAQTTTNDAFALAPLPAHLGYPSQWQNVGTLLSNTIEASLGYNIIKTKKLNWKIRLNFDKIEQRMGQLNIPEFQTGPINAFLVRENEIFGIMYGYQWLRSVEDMEKQLKEGETIADYQLNSDGYVIHTGTEGTIDEKAILLDADRDGKGDKVLIADGNHLFNLSLTSNLSYKAFTLYFMFDWKNGGDIYNYTRQYTYRDNRAVEIDQSGKPEDQKKSIAYYNNFYQGTSVNSYFVEDGSFLKLRELSLYYKLGEKQLGKYSKWVKSINFGIVARNVLTFTNYTGYDPEVASGSDLSNYPFDNFGYPNYRTITGSLEIKF
jgi:TonB-linked SusC/RagA family outer membrane protein